MIVTFFEERKTIMRTTFLKVSQKPRVVAVLTALAGVILALQAHATTITGVLSATTTMGEGFPLVHAIDQSGLSAGYTSGVTDFDTYIAGNPQHTSDAGTDWVSSTTAGVADFNLGSLMAIDRVVLWNNGANLTFAIAQVSLEASADAAFTTPVSLGTFNLAIMSNPNTAQVFSFAPVNAQYVRFENFVSNGASVIALGETAFSTTTAVPEPATVWLLSIGLLGVGAYAGSTRRARKRMSCSVR